MRVSARSGGIISGGKARKTVISRSTVPEIRLERETTKQSTLERIKTYEDNHPNHSSVPDDGFRPIRVGSRQTGPLQRLLHRSRNFSASRRQGDHRWERP